MSILTEDTMKQSQHFLENAGNCGQLAERAADEPTYNRYKAHGSRMAGFGR